MPPSALRLGLVALVALGVSTPVGAGASPEEGSASLGLFLGPRYVPLGHFIQEAQASDDPVSSSASWTPLVMLSFGYRPLSYLEVSMEVGYSTDSLTLVVSRVGITSLPVVGTVRFTPLKSRLYPYVGLGGGCMLNFFTGVPSGELEDHTASFHGLAGVGFELTRRWSLFAEERYEVALPSLHPIGELQTGGNVVLVGIGLTIGPGDPAPPNPKP